MSVVDAGGVTVLGEQRFLELFVVGTRVVGGSGSAIMSHAARTLSRAARLAALINSHSGQCQSGRGSR